MKKFLLLFLSLFIVFSFVACSSREAATTTQTTAQTTKQEIDFLNTGVKEWDEFAKATFDAFQMKIDLLNEAVKDPDIKNTETQEKYNEQLEKANEIVNKTAETEVIEKALEAKFSPTEISSIKRNFSYTLKSYNNALAQAYKKVLELGINLDM